MGPVSQVEVKEVDGQGRIVIPKEWRTRILKGKKVVLRLRDDKIEITAYGEQDLTKFFDVGMVDVEGSLDEWHSFRKGLRRKKP